jgi:hypothetical protein
MQNVSASWIPDPGRFISIGISKPHNDARDFYDVAAAIQQICMPGQFFLLRV